MGALKHRLFILVQVALWSVVGVAQLSADGFRNPPDGAVALGRIGGRIAQIDDATAVSHNPANLVHLEGTSVLGAMTVGHAEKDYSSPMGGSTTTEDPWRALPSVYAAWPMDEGRVVAAIGVNVPFGQSTRWKKDSMPGMAGPYYARMMTVNVNPTVAFRVAEPLSLGVGIDVYRSDLEIRQQVPWAMLTGNPAAPVGAQKMEGDGYGYGANIGVSWQVAPGQRLAATYRSAFEVEYDGDATLTPAPAVPGVLPRTDFETEIDFPAVLGLGYGVAVSDTVSVELNAEWVQHSVYEDLTVDAAENNPMLEAVLGSRTIPQNWRDTWTFGLGGDWQVADDWTLRAGYAYMQSPVPESTLMPSVAEGTQNVVSLGLGYRHGGHSLDLAYVLGLIDSRSVRRNQNPAFNGEYDFSSHLMGVSYGYRF